MTDRSGFRFGFRVRYSEVDYQGIVYFAHYATYFDVAIHEFFRSLPYDYTAIRKTTGTDFNIVRSVVEYRRPLRFDEAFAVEVAPRPDRPHQPDLHARDLGSGRDRAARHRRSGLGARRSGDHARGSAAGGVAQTLACPHPQHATDLRSSACCLPALSLV